MRIAIISYIYPTQKNPSSGIFVHAQAKEIVRQGHKVEVFTSGDRGMKKYEELDGVSIKRICFSQNSGFFIHGLSFGLKIALHLLTCKKKYDIVHSHFLGMSSIIIGKVCRLRNLPYVITSHGTSWEFEQSGALKQALIRASLRYPKKIICVSRATKGILRQYADYRKLVVVGNGVDTSWTKPSTPKRQFKRSLGLQGKKILLSVSDLVEKKGIDIIVKCLPQILSRFPSTHYIIIGDGPEKERLKNKVRELKLGKSVSFTGYLPQKKLADYYNACDVFVLMSRQMSNAMESFGIVYIEASYFGKPVIGGKGGGTADAIEEGKSGFLIDYNKPDKLIKTISDLLKDADLRKRMGDYGKIRIKDKFLWPKIVKDILKLYSESILSV